MGGVYRLVDKATELEWSDVRQFRAQSCPVRIHRFHRQINFVLMLALLLASTLGLMHGTLHAPGLQHLEATLAQPIDGAAQAGGPVLATDEVGPTSPHGWLLKLFDHHDGQQCRLYDQLSNGCAPPGVPLVAVPVVWPAASPRYFLDQAPAWPPALFEARGPPSNH